MEYILWSILVELLILTNTIQNKLWLKHFKKGPVTTTSASNMTDSINTAKTKTNNCFTCMDPLKAKHYKQGVMPPVKKAL